MTSNNICKGHALRIAVGILTLAILLLASGANAKTNIRSCGTNISLPGEYVLNQSISSSSTCINIISSDVILDGAGNTITGTNAVDGIGVYVFNSSIILTNITIKNLNVISWAAGIIYHTITNGSILNNNATFNIFGNGIILETSSNITVSGNNASNNGEGIHLVYSNNNTLSSNIVNWNLPPLAAAISMPAMSMPASVYKYLVTTC